MIRFLSLFILLPFVLFAQVKVNINSGNPALPFPQFQPYTNSTGSLKNLATNTPEGVTHTEMETTIREAYQIMMNRAEKKGGALGGIDYIHFRSTPDCSEGDGYALLAAVAMADKTTFDGLWLWVHENALNNVKLYGNCKPSNPDYKYSSLPGWTNTRGNNSAADGDVDIALALLFAYRQWGEYMGVSDSCGNPISYKMAAVDFITALTDTFTYTTTGTSLVSGDIGLDGYFKGGDSWGELTGWASNTAQSMFTKPPEVQGPKAQYADYMAPAYYTQFADFLSSIDSASYAWNIKQFRRAAASSNWLMGELAKADPKNLPIAGNVEVTGSIATFKYTGNMGEDFRLGWRTVLDRMWHGNPSATWNPETHQVQSGGNSFEEQIGTRFANFIGDPRQDPWNNSCVASVGTDPYHYWGPSMLMTTTGMNGTSPADGFYFLNWMHGVGSPSAVVSQNGYLMAEMFRQCEIEWDVETPGDGYLTSVPSYYHGWFRLLGMLVLSGNYNAPSVITASANVKIYCDVNKTCAASGDTITYTLSIRNYGSADAQNVVIADTLPSGMTFASGSDGGEYDASSKTVVWQVGTVAGFKSATGVDPTSKTVSVRVTVNGAAGIQSVNKCTVKCSNGSGWASNEYPNTISAVMKRNFVDIISKPAANGSGEKLLPVLHGGRRGVAFSCSFDSQATTTLYTMRIRLHHDAHEAYIDYGNYRLSYLLYDTVTTCIAKTDSCPDGWVITPSIVEGIDKNNIRIRHEKLVPGEAFGGKWNQRLMVEFSDTENPKRTEKLSTINQHLSAYRGIGGRIHRGGTSPFRLVVTLNRADYKPFNLSESWSWNSAAADNDGGTYFPVTPDFKDPLPGYPGLQVNAAGRKVCEIAEVAVDNVLIEEWDGYTWRRVCGNLPESAATAVLVQKKTMVTFGIQRFSEAAVSFTIAKQGSVKMEVLDIKGRVVANLLDREMEAGQHTIATDRCLQVPAVRIIRLTTENGTVCRKWMNAGR